MFEYAPAPESRAVVDIKPSYGLFIGGEFVEGSGNAFKSISPATEEVLAEVVEASSDDVDRAVAAARKAYDRTWSKLAPRERGKYLYRIARIIQERSRELAVLESIDNGKPIRESRDVDIPLVAAHFFYYAGWADKLAYAGFGPNPQPLGVAGQVIPWNFPLLMLAWKIAPALAAGNTVVLKPAETTPLTALLFAEICQQAELPPGVVNIITGAGDTGRALVEHPGVDKVAFTGSTEVGKAIARAIAGTSKRATLELGGKAANIVFDEVRARLSGPRDDVHHPGWQIRLLDHLCEQERGERRRLRRLQDDRVPRRERGCDLPRGHQQGEVPRDDLTRHADRLGRAVREGVVELVRPAGVVEEVRRGERQVDVARLLDRLAAVHRLEHGELACALLELARDPVQVLGAFAPGELAPPILGGLARGPDGQVDVLGAGVGDLGERLLGRGADRLEPRPALGIDELPADEQAVARIELDDVGRLGRVGVLPDRLPLLERRRGLLRDVGHRSVVEWPGPW